MWPHLLFGVLQKNEEMPNGQQTIQTRQLHQKLHGHKGDERPGTLKHTFSGTIIGLKIKTTGLGGRVVEAQLASRCHGHPWQHRAGKRRRGRPHPQAEQTGDWPQRCQRPAAPEESEATLSPTTDCRGLDPIDGSEERSRQQPRTV